MTVLKNIGFDEVLDRLGLTESQVKVIYSGEIKKLVDQEQALLGIIDNLGKKSTELYLERQKHAQALENERISIENSRKELISIKNDITNERKKLENEKRDVAALHVRLDEAKETFRQERVIYGERLAKLEADERAFFKTSADIVQKDRDLENLKDELYLKKRDLDEKLKESEEELKEIDRKKSELLTLKLAIDEDKREFETFRKNELKRLSAIEKGNEEAKDSLEKEKLEFYQEKRNTEDALRERESGIVKKERYIEASEKSVKKIMDEAIIEEGRKKRK